MTSLWVRASYLVSIVLIINYSHKMFPGYLATKVFQQKTINKLRGHWSRDKRSFAAEQKRD